MSSLDAIKTSKSLTVFMPTNIGAPSVSSIPVEIFFFREKQVFPTPFRYVAITHTTLAHEIKIADSEKTKSMSIDHSDLMAK